MDNQILDAALEYASRGWSVIPISREKHPLVEWKAATREELTNPETIKNWWRKYPSANVAIVTGKRSGGLVVIDLDIDDDKGLDGVAALEEWCDENYIYDIESTAVVQTGRGGKHLYFQSAYEYRNQVGCLEGVDIRGEGGCVVAPPSIHGETGREYIWDVDDDEITVPEADSDVVFFLTTMEATGKNTGNQGKNDFTEKTSQGGRNDKLFKYISHLQGVGESDESIREYASIYNTTHLTPPLDDEEVNRTIDSVLSRYPKGQPKEDGKQAPAGDTPKKVAKEFRKLQKASDLMKEDIPEPVTYIGVGDEVPLLVEGTCVLSSKPKLGKSWLALGMCIALANGNDFLGYKTKQCSTLYLDLETSKGIQQKRLRKMLKGAPAPERLYLDRNTDRLGNGFIEQIEDYMKQDPTIGVVVVDVFQIIRSPAKGVRETEYEHAYRDITPLNDLVDKYHISIILVCHDRKGVNPDDPFENILGSTGIQGAATQMMVMYRRKKEDPIHISVKGKSIDGLPELDVKLENAEWFVVEGGSSADRERALALSAYRESTIRQAVLAIADHNEEWKGRSGQLINMATGYNIGIVESAKEVGGFLHRNQGLFMAEDGIQILFIGNGTGSTIYRIKKSTIDTIDENVALTIDGFEKPVNSGAPEVPFL